MKDKETSVEKEDYKVKLYMPIGGLSFLRKDVPQDTGTNKPKLSYSQNRGHTFLPLCTQVCSAQNWEIVVLSELTERLPLKLEGASSPFQILVCLSGDGVLSNFLTKREENSKLPTTKNIMLLRYIIASR